MSRDARARLADATLTALCVPGSDWPQGLLSAARIPDTWIGLVQQRDGRRWFAPSGETPRPGDDGTLLLVRNRAITVPIELTGVRAACGNDVDVQCELLVRWRPEEGDLAALLGGPLLTETSADDVGSRSLSLAALAHAVAAAGAARALREFVQARPAEALLQHDLRHDLLASLTAALQRFCFENGASLERVPALRCTSRTHAAAEALRRDTEQHVQRIKAREMVEQAALAATHKRLGELSGVLEKLKSAAAGNENLQWQQLLPSLSPAERGRLLENLWRLTPDRTLTQAIVVVAGAECVWLDPSNPEHVSKRITLPADFGGLRSVAFVASHNWLLIGAATGIWAVHATTGEIAGRFSATAPQAPKTGFNGSVMLGNHIYATHSSLGLWRWLTGSIQGAAAPDANLAAPASPTTAAQGEPLFEPSGGIPRTIRAPLAVADGRLLFAADDCIQAYDPTDGGMSVLVSAGETIHSLALLDRTLLAGLDDGKLLRIELDQPDDVWVAYRGSGPLESIHARRWNDLVEFVIPAGPAGVCGVYTEENVVTRLLDSTTPIRRAWAADDILVGLNDRRDRLIVMNSNSPVRTGREAPVARLLGSSVQDACLVTKTS